jgi:hypothetical protein
MGSVGVYARVTSLFVVPEPGTALLLWLGLASIGWKRIRRE